MSSLQSKLVLMFCPITIFVSINSSAATSLAHGKMNSDCVIQSIAAQLDLGLGYFSFITPARVKLSLPSIRTRATVACSEKVEPGWSLGWVQLILSDHISEISDGKLTAEKSLTEPTPDLDGSYDDKLSPSRKEKLLAMQLSPKQSITVNSEDQPSVLTSFTGDSLDPGANSVLIVEINRVAKFRTMLIAWNAKAEKIQVLHTIEWGTAITAVCSRVRQKCELSFADRAGMVVLKPSQDQLPVEFLDVNFKPTQDARFKKISVLRIGDGVLGVLGTHPK